MSLFDKSYKRILKDVADESAAGLYSIPLNESKTRDNPFSMYVFDISDRDFDPLPASMIYKDIAAKKHQYSIVPKKMPIPHRKNNSFIEAESFLQALLTDNPAVDSDFLTGYYLAIFEFVDLKSKVLESFHAGLTSDGLIIGMYYAFLTISNIRWNFMGCDKVQSKLYSNPKINKYVKGANACNIYTVNTVRSMSIALSEKYRRESLDFYTADVAASTPLDTLYQYMLAVEYVKPEGYIVLRIPLDWTTHWTTMLTILLFFISHYTSVKIFKTPWGGKIRMYLILHGVKDSIDKVTLTSIMSYLKLNNPTVPLYNRAVFELDSDDVATASTSDGIFKSADFMANFEKNVEGLYEYLIAFEDARMTSADYCTNVWTSLVEKAD